jgi:hypothetical protein
MLLFKIRRDKNVNLDADWVFGDNFLQRYCVLFEYAIINSRIGFADSSIGRDFNFSQNIMIVMVFLFGMYF